MKKLILTAIIAFGGLLTAQAQTPDVQATPDPKAAEIKFDKETHDFGSIPQGTPATYSFEFKNTGDAPLQIINILSTKECSILSKPTSAIQPGQSGKIEVKYNMTPGPIRKTITVETNAVNQENGRVALKIKGEVI